MAKWVKTIVLFVLTVAAHTAATAEDAGKTQSVLAGLQVSPEEVARQRAALEISKACEPVDEAEQWQHFLSDGLTKWDRQAMSCAIDSGFAEAMRSPQDLAVVYPVWSAAIDYFEVLDLLFDPYYKGGDLFVELGWRWEKNIARASALTEMLSATDLDGDSKLVFEALLPLTRTMQESSTLEEMMALGEALPKLTTAVGNDLAVAEGLGAMLLGRVLFQAPAFAGGDPAKAAELLGSSIQTNPNLFHSYPWLIDALLVLERFDEASEVLALSKKVDVAAINAQDYADFSKRMRGMAIRLNDPDAEAYFDQARTALFTSHPYLLPREAQANMGHGGFDPFTGKKLD